MGYKVFFGLVVGTKQVRTSFHMGWAKVRDFSGKGLFG